MEFGTDDNGASRQSRVDNNGQLYVNMGTKLDSTNDSITTKGSPAYATNLIASTAGTNIFAFPGVIREIEILDGAALGDITVYDALTVTGTPVIGAFTPVQGQVFARNMQFFIGCTIVLATNMKTLIKWEPL